MRISLFNRQLLNYPSLLSLPLPSESTALGVLVSACSCRVTAQFWQRHTATSRKRSAIASEWAQHQNWVWPSWQRPGRPSSLEYSLLWVRLIDSLSHRIFAISISQLSQRIQMQQLHVLNNPIGFQQFLMVVAFLFFGSLQISIIFVYKSSLLMRNTVS